MPTAQKKLEQTIGRYLKKTKPKVLYDIGVGLKSEAHSLKDLWPDLKIFGCEPHPGIYEQIARSFPGVLYPFAVSDKPGPIKFYMSDEAPMQSSTFRPSGNYTERNAVTIDQIDDWAQQPEDIILWLDIEGSELKALLGAQRLLTSKRVLAINTEVWYDPPYEGWPTFHDLVNYLKPHGYLLRAEYAQHQTHCDVIFLRA